MKENIKHFANTRAVVKHLAGHISGKTIDFGAGSAKYKSIIAPHATEYIAFDMIPGEHIDVVGDALNPPFDDNSVDTVISNQVLEHVERPWEVAHQIHRILKPGGVCIVTAPFLIPYHADPHDFFRYTKEGLESLFVHEEFIVLESSTYGSTPTVLAEMVHFSLFSHYTKRSRWRGVLRNLVVRSIKRIAKMFDRAPSDKTVYANSYIVVQKQ